MILIIKIVFIKNNEELHKIRKKEIVDVYIGRDMSPNKRQE